MSDRDNAWAAGLSPAGRESRREVFLPNKPILAKQSHFRAGPLAGPASSLVFILL